MSVLMRININEQRAQIGLNITRSNLNINNPSAAIQINDQRSQVQIHSEQPTFTADHSAVRRDMGLSTSGQFAQDFANAGRQAAMQGIGRRAREGDQMANAQVRGVDPMPMIARNNANARLGPIPVNIGLMPRSSPHFTWHVNRLQIGFTPHSLSVNTDPTNLAQVSLTPQHSVSTFYQTPPHMDITAVPLYA
ncbi:MAG: DUF6470 family protein [Oscillospiraceae bacterium]|nr:DUF6470 family protein [Oscillospiraceae bacterium]